MATAPGGNQEEYPMSEWEKSFQHVKEWEAANALVDDVPVEEPEPAPDPEPTPKKKSKK